jgi:hypothetical protein
LATWIYYTWPHMAVCNKSTQPFSNYTRPIVHVYKIHVYNWTRVLIHVYLLHAAMWPCKKYMQLLVWLIQLATLSSRHVASCPRVYSNRYYRHAADCAFFCICKSNIADIRLRVVSCRIYMIDSTKNRFLCCICIEDQMVKEEFFWDNILEAIFKNTNSITKYLILITSHNMFNFIIIC